MVMGASEEEATHFIVVRKQKDGKKSNQDRSSKAQFNGLP